jgi:hypothetical protein
MQTWPPAALMVRLLRSRRSVQSRLQTLRRRRKLPQKQRNWHSNQRQMPMLPPAPPLQQGPTAQQPQQRQLQQERALAQRPPSRSAGRRIERRLRGDSSGRRGEKRRTGSQPAPCSQSPRSALKLCASLVGANVDHACSQLLCALSRRETPYTKEVLSISDRRVLLYAGGGVDSCRRCGGVVQQPRRPRVHSARPPNHRVRRLLLGSW